MPTASVAKAEASPEDFKRRVAQKLEHGKGASWMATVSPEELASMQGSNNRLFQFLIEGKKAKSLSFDLETLRAASHRGDLFTFRQCEKIEQVYRQTEARFDEFARKEKAERERKRAQDNERRSLEDQMLLMPMNSPVVLVNLTKDQTLNRSMGTYEGKAPQGRHRVRLYKDNRLLSIKEDNICRYEDFLAQQDRAKYESYGNELSDDNFSDDDSSEEPPNLYEGDQSQVEWQSRNQPSTKSAPEEEIARSTGASRGFSIFRRVIKAPSSRLGFLIGRKQSTLRHIEAETGIRSIVIGKKVVDGVQEVILTGGKDSVEMAEKLCWEILTAKDEKATAKGTPSQPKESQTKASQAIVHKQDEIDMETVCIPVPQLVVKDLIGKKGVNLSGITRSSRASRISILDPVESGLRQARIIGRPQAVNKAVKLIEDFCDDKIPGYKKMYNIREGEGENQPKNIKKEAGELAEAEKPSFKNQLPTSSPVMSTLPSPQNRESDAVDPLLVFLTSQKVCLKCSPEEFYDWLQSEDVVSFEELAEAVEDSDFVSQMQARGLKGFKRTAFVKAVHAQGTTGAVSKPQRSSLEAPPELECPISHVLMVCDPVVASDGNVYERAAIEEWFQRSRENGSSVVRSPLTNEILKDLNLTSVSTVKNMAKEFCSRGEQDVI